MKSENICENAYCSLSGSIPPSQHEKNSGLLTQVHKEKREQKGRQKIKIQNYKEKKERDEEQVAFTGRLDGLVKPR